MIGQHFLVETPQAALREIDQPISHAHDFQTLLFVDPARHAARYGFTDQVDDGAAKLVGAARFAVEFHHKLAQFRRAGQREVRRDVGDVARHAGQFAQFLGGRRWLDVIGRIDGFSRGEAVE